MSRSLIDRMLDEMELSSFVNYQNWCFSHVGPVCYNLPGLHAEYRNNIRSDRSKFFNDYYCSQYWPVANLAYVNYDPFNFARRNEKKNIYYENGRYGNGDKYFKNRMYFEKGHQKAHSKNDRNSFSSGHYQADRTLPLTMTKNEVLQRYRQMQQEDYYARISSRYGGKNMKPEIKEIHPPLSQAKDIYKDRESASPVNSVAIEECIADEQSSSGNWSSESIASKSNIVEEDGKSMSKKSSGSQISVFTDVEPSQKLENNFASFASWYCTEEQEQIIEVLREVNMRHDRQLRRDILASQNGVLGSEESCASNSDSLNKETSQCSMTSDEEEQITIVLSPDHTSQIPVIVDDKDASGYDPDYLEKSANDYFEEFQSIFTVSPEKKLINALTKENLKTKLQEENCLTSKEGISIESVEGNLKGRLEFKENEYLIKNQCSKDVDISSKDQSLVSETLTTNLVPDVNTSNIVSLYAKRNETSKTFENDCNAQSQSKTDGRNRNLKNENTFPKLNNTILSAHFKKANAIPKPFLETTSKESLNFSTPKIQNHGKKLHISSPSFKGVKKQNDVKIIENPTSFLSNSVSKFQVENTIWRKHPFSHAKKQKSCTEVNYQNALKANELSDMENVLKREVAKINVGENQIGIFPEESLALINSVLQGKKVPSDTCLIDKHYKHKYIQSNCSDFFSDPHLQQGNIIHNYKRISVDEILRPDEKVEVTKHLKQLLNIQNFNNQEEVRDKISVSYSEHLKHILGIENANVCADAKSGVTNSNKYTSTARTNEKQSNFNNNSKSFSLNSSAAFSGPSCKVHLSPKDYSSNSQKSQTTGLAARNTCDIPSANRKLITEREKKYSREKKSSSKNTDLTPCQFSAKENEIKNLLFNKSSETLSKHVQNISEPFAAEDDFISISDAQNTAEIKKIPHAEHACRREQEKSQKISKQKTKKEEENNHEASAIKVLPNSMDKCVSKELPKIQGSQLHNIPPDGVATAAESSDTIKYPKSFKKTNCRTNYCSKKYFNHRNFNEFYDKEHQTQRQKVIKPFSKFNHKEKLHETPKGEKSENVSLAIKMNISVQNIEKSQPGKQQAGDGSVTNSKSSCRNEKKISNKLFQNDFKNQKMGTQSFDNSKVGKRKSLDGKSADGMKRSEKNCVCSLERRTVVDASSPCANQEKFKQKKELVQKETNVNENIKQTARKTSERKLSVNECNKNSFTRNSSNAECRAASFTKNYKSEEKDKSFLDKNSSPDTELLSSSTEKSLTADYAKVSSSEKSLTKECNKNSLTEISLTKEHDRNSLNPISLTEQCIKNYLTKPSLTENSTKSFRNENPSIDEFSKPRHTIDINRKNLENKNVTAKNVAYHDRVIKAYLSAPLSINSSLVRTQNILNKLKEHDLKSNQENNEKQSVRKQNLRFEINNETSKNISNISSSTFKISNLFELYPSDLIFINFDEKHNSNSNRMDHIKTEKASSDSKPSKEVLPLTKWERETLDYDSVSKQCSVTELKSQCNFKDNNNVDENALYSIKHYPCPLCITKYETLLKHLESFSNLPPEQQRLVPRIKFLKNLCTYLIETLLQMRAQQQKKQ